MRTSRKVLFVTALTFSGPFASSLFAYDQNVIFAFDQTRDYLLRLLDLNDDGDAIDPGEVVIFMNDADAATGLDNSQGLLALSPYEVFATDNFVPDNVLRLNDLNRDGDALDPGESTIWWDGMLPDGLGLMMNPVCISTGPDDAYYLIDNNSVGSTSNPEAIYRMDDLNNDGDVNDAGEVTQYFELSPPSTAVTVTFDLEFDNAGAGYVYDIRDPNQIEHIDRISPDATTKTVWIDSAALFQMTGVVFVLSQDLVHDPLTDEIITSGTLGSSTVLIAMRDQNNSDTIDSGSEVRLLWRESEAGVSVGSARGICLLPNRSMYFTEALNDQIIRMVDLNEDGDYRDAGETNVFYDSAMALASGLPDAPQLLSITGAPLPPIARGDMNCDGVVSVGDIGPFVLALTDPAGYEAQFPDCDIDNGDINNDEIVSVGDIGAFVALLTGG
ncbi:MAG: hypothetical protein AB7N71_08375 [Phycisphaerae bacterium]